MNRRRKKVPAQSGHEPDVTALHAIHPSRDLNLESPLLCLPTELILEIFAHSIELDSSDGDDDHRRHLRRRRCRLQPLVLTAICHHLRETGIASPQLWSTVDLTTPLLAELFLERCYHDPHTLMKFPSASERLSMYPVENPIWEKLEGRTFNGLRSIVFEGTSKLDPTIISIIQRAPNISNLDLLKPRFDPWQMSLPPLGDLMPNLSTLCIGGFWISWTSPLLRNLSQLSLDFDPPSIEHTSIEVFLTALANCLNIEILKLTHAGPDSLNGLRDNCVTVVQLLRLRELSLKFHDPSRVGHILSHIEYPESTKLMVNAQVGRNTDLSETISQVLPRRNAQNIRLFHNSTSLTVCLDKDAHFITDNLLIRFVGPVFLQCLIDPEVWTRFASKIVEVVRGDTITSLAIDARGVRPSHGFWVVFLHGLPSLERIRYGFKQEEGHGYIIDSFVLVFSEPFDGGPVWPQLQHLELPERVLTEDAAFLRHALESRGASGRRLKRIGVSGGTVGDRGVLEQFRDLVDEVQ